jgi:hypothetical protein
MRLRAIFLSLLVVITACSKLPQITPADRQYIFAPVDIDHFPIKNYRHELTWSHTPYIFFKTYTEQFGFRGLFGTILLGPQGDKVKYLCLVNIFPTNEQARDVFVRMTPEPSPRVFGMEETIDPRLYHADEAYLYTDDTSYFHLILQASRVVYTIVLEGAPTKESQVRNGLVHKLAYIQHHLNTMR